MDLASEEFTGMDAAVAAPADAAEATRRRKKKKKQLPLKTRQLIAWHRFGLGARPGTFAKAMGKDPKKALIKELNTPGVALIPQGDLPTYAEACEAGERGSTRGGTLNSYQIFYKEVDARFDKHLAVPIGFVERLVIFWSNHFTVNRFKEVIRIVEGTVGQLERDVIRRNVLGRFDDMLVGVITHPAMVCYLDNHLSVGPNSQLVKENPGYELNGVKLDGTNVNLAREIMELHSLGTGGGYTEADVKALANIISGWSRATESEVGGGYNGAAPGTYGQFLFKPKWHEPGPQTHLGKSWPDEGVQTGIKVLRSLARRKACAQFLAFKLVRHFITDKPTKAMVDPVAKAYIKSGGRLKPMYLALLNLDAAWKPLKKFRTPYETVAAQYRALGKRHGDVNYNNGIKSNYVDTEHNLKFLNQKTWECLDPDGWDDDSAEWLNPDGLRVRIAAWQQAVNTFAGDFAGSPLALAKSVLGRNLSAATVAAISAAPTPQAGLTILFSSPEFQRR